MSFVTFMEQSFPSLPLLRISFIMVLLQADQTSGNYSNFPSLIRQHKPGEKELRFIHEEGSTYIIFCILKNSLHRRKN